MKLNQFNRKVMTNGGETSKFTAEMNPAFFAVASDTMYQYKIAAIIRETCSNANDSHMDANKEDVPFHVVLPNDFNPNFVVEDFGIGLDDDGVRTVFASYFKSTKNNSVRQTGGFGIGAKSVFSYSDTFEIIARKDGVERTYVAFIGDDGIPEVQNFSEAPTDHGNGVRIKIPVQKKDFQKFYGEAEVILSFFPTTPVVTGGMGVFEPLVTDLHEQIEQNDYALIPFSTGSDLYSGNAVYAMVNNVLYPISNSIFQDIENYDFIKIVRGMKSIVLKFEDGSLPPAAPRESLSLNEKTKEYIREYLNLVLGVKREEFQKKVDSFTHPKDALEYVDDKFGWKGKTAFTYNERKIGYYVDRKYKIPFSEYHMVRHTYRGPSRKARNIPITVSDTRRSFTDIVIVYRLKGEKETPVKTHIAKYIKKYEKGSNTLFIHLDGCPKTRPERVKKLLGLESVKIIDNLSLREDVKSTRISPKRTYDNGEKTDTTVYARTINKHGVFEVIRHVDVTDGTNYLVVPAALVETEKFTKPRAFGEYEYIIQNANNYNKIQKLGIKSVTEVAEKYVKDNPDFIKYLKLMKVFGTGGFRGKSRLYDRALRVSTNGDIVAARNLHEEYVALMDKHRAIKPKCPIIKAVVDSVSNDYSEVADKALKIIEDRYGFMESECLPYEKEEKIVKMIDFCYENGFNDNLNKTEDKEGEYHGIV